MTFSDGRNGNLLFKLNAVLELSVARMLVINSSRRYQFSLDVFVYESMRVLPPLSQVSAKARLWNLEWTCELDYSTDIQTEFKIDVELV